jgi:hypothetical protein
MREFYVLVNEYPWTSLALGYLLFCLVHEVAEAVKK